MIRQIFRKLGWMAQRRRKEAELRDELEFHLQEEGEQAEAAGLTAAILLTVAALAGYIPARSALQVDPMMALRHE